MSILGIQPDDYYPPLTVEYLVIAGGGGGSSGGGGAGGMLSNIGSPIIANTSTEDIHNSYIIAIGAGGARGANGSNSVFYNITAIGGGFGADFESLNGGNGGSGGGGYYSGVGGTGVPGQGYSGGNNLGGGGGAFAAGGSEFPYGGNGKKNSIASTSAKFAGGGAGFYGIADAPGGEGGGGSSSGAPSGTAYVGQENTGGGGAGGDDSNPFGVPYIGNNGGSGLVVLKYPKEYHVYPSSGAMVHKTILVGSTHKVTYFISGAGTIEFKKTGIVFDVDQLVVAGGGGGGNSNYSPASGFFAEERAIYGGGGGGGVKQVSGRYYYNDTISLFIGAGGTDGGIGSDSRIEYAGYISNRMTGGGGPHASGGSGGGGSILLGSLGMSIPPGIGEAPYGNNGGNYANGTYLAAGGGGGLGSPGLDGNVLTGKGGDGGEAVEKSTAGPPILYAAGGGGSGHIAAGNTSELDPGIGGSSIGGYGAKINGMLADGTVSAIATDTSGKIIVSGSFINWNGASRKYLVRLNPDGTEDIAFSINIASATNNGIGAIAIQSDGKILLGGWFTTWNGNSANYIVRLNSDGTRDQTFTTNVGTAANQTVTSIAVQSNGKIIIAGEFTTWNGITAINRLVRLNSDGTRDTSFSSNLGSAANNTVSTIALQSDNKIVLGGLFTTWNGTTVNYIVRLKVDGTRDTAFTTNTGTAGNSYVYKIILQPDNKILVCGFFTTWGGTTVNRIVRLNSNGSRETSFNTNTGTAANNTIYTVALQPDGKILLGGFFTTWKGTTVNGLVRLNTDGTHDTDFTSNTNLGANNSGANAYVQTILPQADGKSFIGGAFAIWNGVVVGHFTRINMYGGRDKAISASVTKATSGQVNTGSGGGSGGLAGNGASGTIIFSYDSSLPALSVDAGLVYETYTYNSKRIYKFTGGTGMVRFG